MHIVRLSAFKYVKCYWKNISFIVIFFIFANTSYGQSDFWASKHAYLGQTPPGDSPVKFAPRMINDSPFFSMDRSAFSNDGREFFYVRNNTWFSTKESSIQTFDFVHAKWQGPKTLVKQYYAPVFSMSGDTIFLNGGGKGNIMEMHRTAKGWSDAGLFMKRSYGLYDFMPTRSGRMYAASNVNGPVSDFSCYDICVMQPLSTGDTTIKSLGRPVNTAGFDGDFYISPDESFMVISAREHPDYECELFISYHKSNGKWTNPKSLGTKINNGPAHRWGEYVTPDRKYLFYSYGHGPKDCALYWVRFDSLLEKLKHTNFEPYINMPLMDQAFNAFQDFTFPIPGDVFEDDDGKHTLHYTAAMADGSPLPPWINFDPIGKRFYGKTSSPGKFELRVTATDPENASADTTFKLTVRQ
jgi:Putative Ig domain